MTRNEILRKICDASYGGYLGLFVGAGFTKSLLEDSYEYDAYSWEDLLKECCKELKVDDFILNRKTSYPELASEICKKYCENDLSGKITYEKAIEELKKTIAKKVTIFPPKEIESQFTDYFNQIKVSWFVTTNYDTVIETILKEKALPLGPEDFFFKKENEIPVYHIHGIRYSPSGIVITNEDYAKYFRPNDYRPARLPFLIKESLVLMVGYGLGDLNVLTAVDLAKNVYKDKGESFPIVQLLFCEESAKIEPYQDASGIWIVEINSISSFFDELIQEQNNAENARSIIRRHVRNGMNVFSNPSNYVIESFIKNEKGRKVVIRFLSSLEREYHSVYLQFENFLHQVVSSCRAKEAPYGAFEAYNVHLKVILDLLKIPVRNMPISFFSTLASELDHIAYYVDDRKGGSYAAYETWKNEAPLIPSEMIAELKQYCAGQLYYHTELERILGMI